MSVLLPCWTSSAHPHPHPQSELYSGASGAPAKTTTDDRSGVCVDYAEDGFECVPFDLCLDGEIVVDGGGLIDIR